MEPSSRFETDMADFCGWRFVVGFIGYKAFNWRSEFLGDTASEVKQLDLEEPVQPEIYGSPYDNMRSRQW